MVKTIEFYTNIQQALDFVDVGVVNRVVKHWREKYQSQFPSLVPRWRTSRIFIIGNGGSCAISEHISTDLNKRCKVEAHTLSNNSLATCLSNDYGYENAFTQWLMMNEFNKEDFLVAISSSGKSPNILNAIHHAQDCLAPVFAIFGMNGNTDFLTDFLDWDDLRNYFIHIDSYNYGVIELTSEIILHGIVEELVIE